MKIFSQSTKWALMSITLGPFWLIKQINKQKKNIWIEMGKLEWTFSNSAALLYFILLGETRLPSGFLSVFSHWSCGDYTPTCSCMHLRLMNDKFHPLEKIKQGVKTLCSSLENGAWMRFLLFSNTLDFVYSSSDRRKLPTIAMTLYIIPVF